MRLDWSRFSLAAMDWSPLFISIKTAATALLLVLVLGLWTAWKLSKARPRISGFFDCLFTLPMVLPPTVAGVFLLMTFGKNSPVGRLLLSLGIQVVFSWPATVIAAATAAFPLMYRACRGAFAQLDESLLNAGRTLGKKESWLFFHVALPLCRPGVTAGAMLAFARALGEFGATLMLAGNIPGRTQTIPIAIYFAVQGGKNELAMVWVAVIFFISLTTAAVTSRLCRKKGAEG